MFSDGFPRLAPVNRQKRKGRSSRNWINGRLTGSSLIRRQIDLGDFFLLGFCLRFPLFYCMYWTCLTCSQYSSPRRINAL